MTHEGRDIILQIWSFAAFFAWLILMPDLLQQTGVIVRDQLPWLGAAYVIVFLLVSVLIDAVLRKRDSSSTPRNLFIGYAGICALECASFLSAILSSEAASSAGCLIGLCSMGASMALWVGMLDAKRIAYGGVFGIVTAGAIGCLSCVVIALVGNVFNQFVRATAQALVVVWLPLISGSLSLLSLWAYRIGENESAEPTREASSHTTSTSTNSAMPSGALIVFCAIALFLSIAYGYLNIPQAFIGTPAIASWVLKPLLLMAVGICCIFVIRIIARQDLVGRTWLRRSFLTIMVIAGIALLVSAALSGLLFLIAQNTLFALICLAWLLCMIAAAIEFPPASKSPNDGPSSARKRTLAAVLSGMLWAPWAGLGIARSFGFAESVYSAMTIAMLMMICIGAVFLATRKEPILADSGIAAGTVAYAIASSEKKSQADDFQQSAQTIHRARKEFLSGYALTPQELRAAMLAIENKPNAIIAEKLGVKEGTVKRYLSDVYRKTEVNSKYELRDKVDAALIEGANANENEGA